MGSGLTCPLCNQEITAAPIKSWKFGDSLVNRYECALCKARFNVHSSAKGKTATTNLTLLRLVAKAKAGLLSNAILPTTADTPLPDRSGRKHSL